MLDYKIHERHMISIVKNIFSDKIGNFLAFKGGTLAYFVHGLDRFSTDIDIDILDISQEELIIKEIRKILALYGEIKNETLGKNIHRWVFRYDEKSMNIKIELNKKIWKNNIYLYENIDHVQILCMSKKCIFANKLVALSERFYSRDLYDVYFFFSQNFPIYDALIYERTGITTKTFLQQLIKNLPKHFRENTVLAGLGEILDNKQKLWVKSHLLNEIIKEIEKHL